jgi:hypothetical protein
VSKTPEAQRAEWTEQIETITQEVYAIHHHRDLWRRLAEITQAAKLPASVFFDALSMWYAATQSVAVRRQLDTSKGTVSLIRLLEDLERHRGHVTREWHVSLWVGDKPEPVIDMGDGWTWTPFLDEAQANFDRFAGDRAHEHLDRGVVQADIARLKDAGAAVQTYVNEAIAHATLNRKSAVVTYAELNGAIDVVAELVGKYTSLLKAQAIAQFEPDIQQDWTAIFRQPWIDPS